MAPEVRRHELRAQLGAWRAGLRAEPGGWWPAGDNACQWALGSLSSAVFLFLNFASSLKGGPFCIERLQQTSLLRATHKDEPHKGHQFDGKIGDCVRKHERPIIVSAASSRRKHKHGHSLLVGGPNLGFFPKKFGANLSERPKRKERRKSEK